MKNYLSVDPWKVVETGFHPEHNRITESIFSLGNGYMGQRANFEEEYSGDTLQGNYISGIYYPDKTRVGWWKIGYPEYFAKVLNAANWIGIRIWVNAEDLDLHRAEILSFQRVLDMKKGVLSRNFTVRLSDGQTIAIESTRFCSYACMEGGFIRYSVKALDKDVEMQMEPYVDFDVINEDSNYDEKFWIEKEQHIDQDSGYVLSETKKTGFRACVSMKSTLTGLNADSEVSVENITKSKYCSRKYSFLLKRGQEIILYKYVTQTTSFHHAKGDIIRYGNDILKCISSRGFEHALEEHEKIWARKWAESDILIEGDLSAQQGIRFNIFQLNQTYSGQDPRLNIGPKGFTGEKYGGTTYWDTEAYCLPFYLGTAPQEVARNLLIYRYNHLEKAIENAEKLGFSNGAALYPMVTMNGEECHNEWEITFEEIHRNGAIAYAIYNYINYTGDAVYLEEYGLEVLIAIARFWAQRVNWSNARNRFVMLGVTGPNEYENNVNNNWYTNYLAKWCLDYCAESIEYVNTANSEKFEIICRKTSLDTEQEIRHWKEISAQMYLPQNDSLGVFLQQDGFLDKIIEPVSQIPPDQRPINQHWSWDRILRSCYIKQADVLQGLYFFEKEFDRNTLQRNFDFYEPLTVHESSLSPCIHSILAARLGRSEKAYEMYLRTARLDLDDYNNDTEDGLHITSMAGTWMSIVMGMGGVRISNGDLHIDPFLPGNWDSFKFKLRFRSTNLAVEISEDKLVVNNAGGSDLEIHISGKNYTIRSRDRLDLPFANPF